MPYSFVIRDAALARVNGVLRASRLETWEKPVTLQRVLRRIAYASRLHEDVIEIIADVRAACVEPIQEGETHAG